MTEKFRHAGTVFEVDLAARTPSLRLRIDGRGLDIRETAEAVSGPLSLEVEGRRIEGWRHVEGNDVFLRLDGRNFHLIREVAGDSLSASPGGGSDLRASMPGVVVSVACAEGQAVTKGQTLIVIESMKMQTTITAPRDGVVARIHCTENKGFEKGATLVSLESQQE